MMNQKKTLEFITPASEVFLTATKLVGFILILEDLLYKQSKIKHMQELKLFSLKIKFDQI